MYCFCAKFGQLILRKIIKIVASFCHHIYHILRLKCIKIQFRLGLRPRPRWGSLTRSPDPLLVVLDLMGLLLRKRRGVK